MTRVAVPDTALIADPAVYERGVPHEALRRLRHNAPVVWVDQPTSAIPGLPPVPGDGFWAVLRHAEVEQVLRSPRLYSSHLGGTQIFDAPFPPILDELRRMMINMDPPDHSRLRGLLTKAFTPRAVGRLVERIQQRATALVDAVSENGSADFAKEVAADLPLLTLADILGVPESDRWLMFDWSNRVIGFQDTEYSASASFDAQGGTEMARRALAERPVPDENRRMPDPRMRAGMADLYAYARELGEYKREHPGDDVMSILMQQVDSDGGRVAVAEFENLFWLFSIAGNETVRNALPGGLYALLHRPDQYQLLRRRPDLVRSAVEEMLRWWTPVIHFRRTATEDTEVAGTPIAAGQKVVAFFVSANRDELVFDDPDRFDISRSPNPHLAFGHGPHFCIAAHLAREQMRAMLSAVLARWSHIEPAGEPVRLRSNFQNGIKHLPIRWALA
jgi:cytochrome P450